MIVISELGVGSCASCTAATSSGGTPAAGTAGTVPDTRGPKSEGTGGGTSSPTATGPPNRFGAISTNVAPANSRHPAPATPNARREDPAAARTPPSRIPSPGAICRIDCSSVVTSVIQSRGVRSCVSVMNAVDNTPLATPAIAAPASAIARSGASASTASPAAIASEPPVNRTRMSARAQRA